MNKINYDGTKEYPFMCTLGTASIYEQEFGTDLIADVYGKIDTATTTAEVISAEFVVERLVAANGGKELPKTTMKLIDEGFPAVASTVIDYTVDNWSAYIRALWAMLKTADIVNGTNNIPSFKVWQFQVTAIDMHELSHIVIDSCQKGLFRSGVTTISQ